MNHIEWLGYLASLCENVHYFTPKEATENCTFSRQTVHTRLREFVKRGYLRKEGRGKYSINESNESIQSILNYGVSHLWSQHRVYGEDR